MPSRTTLTGEEGLERRLGLSEVLQNTFVCGLVAVDSGRRIVALNAQAERMLGLSVSDALGQSIQVLGEPLREVMEESIVSCRHLSNRRVDLPTSVTPILTVSTIVFRASDPGGLAAVAVLNEFITALKLEWSIRRLNRLATIGTLSASVAHEIKNALVAIKTFANALTEEDRKTGLGEIVANEIERINSIVGQMLKFSGSVTPNLTRLQVHDVLNQSLRLVQHQMSEKKIRLFRDFTASSDSVKGDSYQLEQAFLNLFLNALAATSSGGEIRVNTESLSRDIATKHPDLDTSQRWLRITVTDTGNGIAPEAMERLFEPFFTTKPDGTGLGLSITRRIVHEHGGFITVESRLQQGTTFSILLPNCGDEA